MTRNSPEPIIDHKNELCRLLRIVLQRFLLVFTEATAKNIGRRLEMLSGASWLPGVTDKHGVAACLDMEERGAEAMLNRAGVPYRKPGNVRLYELDCILADKSTDPIGGAK